jgi:DNA-3-methyladenine glycosylase
MSLPGRKLPRRFYERETLQVARDLIGMQVVHVDEGVRRVGRIVETEAYRGPEDAAAHSAKGRTRRNEVMFGPPGYAYVYLIYGMWCCLNVVTRPASIPQAVLIRGIEPLEGLSGGTWGPGLLCRALNVDRRLNGADLCGAVLWIEAPAPPPLRKPRIARAPRIGVDYAGHWAQKPWRFFDRESVHVSTVSAATRSRAAKTEGRPAVDRLRHGRRSLVE